MSKLSSLIDPQELIQLSHSKAIVLIDARAGLNAQENYEKEHLKSARYVDLNKDLATVDCNPKNGGRHPLPSLEKFTGKPYHNLSRQKRLKCGFEILVDA